MNIRAKWFFGYSNTKECGLLWEQCSHGIFSLKIVFFYSPKVMKKVNILKRHFSLRLHVRYIDFPKKKNHFSPKVVKGMINFLKKTFCNPSPRHMDIVLWANRGVPIAGGRHEEPEDWVRLEEELPCRQFQVDSGAFLYFLDDLEKLCQREIRITNNETTSQASVQSHAEEDQETLLLAVRHWSSIRLWSTTIHILTINLLFFEFS